jgi:hypothetical protein
MSRRLSYLSLGILLLANARWATTAWASGPFTPFVPEMPPQRAVADFDGDGRPDVAFIQEAQGRTRLWISILGSSGAVRLEVNAVSVAASDVDHDGDADLVVAMPSNQVEIWLNDGHGHFTEEPPQPSSSLSPVTTVGSTGHDEPAPPTPSTPQLVDPRGRREAVVGGARVPPPTASSNVVAICLAHPSLRAPPLARTSL